MTRVVQHWMRRSTRHLVLEPVPVRVPDRSKGYFGQGRWGGGLTPAGRPSDIYGDVIVSVARMRFLEDEIRDVAKRGTQ